MSIDKKKIQKEIKTLTDIILIENSSPESLEYKTIPFGFKDEGFISLANKSYPKYIALYRYLITEYCKNQLMSKKFVQEQLNHTILRVLDIFDKNPEKNKQQRVLQLTDELIKSLKRDLQDYTFYFPVHELSPNGLPWKFGEIEFFVLQKEFLSDSGINEKSINYFEIEELSKHAMNDYATFFL